MNDPQDPLPPYWNALVDRARQDPPPPLDPQELLRALRTEPLGAPPAGGSGWWPEFAGLFGSRPVLAGVALAVVAFCAVAVWQTSLVLEEVMPWAELMAGDENLLTGGLL